MHAKEDRVNYRPPSKPPYILNVDGEVMGSLKIWYQSLDPLQNLLEYMVMLIEKE